MLRTILSSLVVEVPLEKNEFLRYFSFLQVAAADAAVLMDDDDDVH